MKLVAANEEMKRSCQEKAFTHGALVAGLGQDVPTLELLNLFTNGSGVVVSSFHLSLKLCDVLTVLLKGVAYRTLEVINDHEVWKEMITNYNILCLLFQQQIKSILAVFIYFRDKLCTILSQVSVNFVLQLCSNDNILKLGKKNQKNIDYSPTLTKFFDQTTSPIINHKVSVERQCPYL